MGYNFKWLLVPVGTILSSCRAATLSELVTSCPISKDVQLFGKLHLGNFFKSYHVAKTLMREVGNMITLITGLLHEGGIDGMRCNGAGWEALL
jgi:hypothetical protein